MHCDTYIKLDTAIFVRRCTSWLVLCIRLHSLTRCTMVDSMEEPSPLAEGKENDFKVLLRAAEAIASPMPKMEPIKKKSSPETTVDAASLKKCASMESTALPELSRLISKEDDEEAFFQSSLDRQPRDNTMPQLADSSAAVVAAASKEVEHEDISTLICKDILPSKKTETAATATASSTLTKSSISLKRARQPGPDFWTFSKKRVPQATKDRKLCSFDKCTNISVNSGVCYRHGAKRRLCKAEGCTLVALQKGVCLRHGAKHPRCSAEGCDKQAQNGGVCRKHGAKVKLCSSEGCTNKARKGGVCIKHGATTLQCSSAGCTNHVMSGGVCYAHGAKRRRCAHGDCPNQVVKGGLCHRHREQSSKSL